MHVNWKTVPGCHCRPASPQSRLPSRGAHSPHPSALHTPCLAQPQVPASAPSSPRNAAMDPSGGSRGPSPEDSDGEGLPSIHTLCPSVPESAAPSLLGPEPPPALASLEMVPQYTGQLSQDIRRRFQVTNSTGLTATFMNRALLYLEGAAAAPGRSHLLWTSPQRKAQRLPGPGALRGHCSVEALRPPPRFCPRALVRLRPGCKAARWAGGPAWRPTRGAGALTLAGPSASSAGLRTDCLSCFLQVTEQPAGER